jgi:hypothetical protein
MRRLTILVCALSLIAAAGPAFVLKPEAAQAIQVAFERMKPTLKYESVQIDRDHVLASVCPTDGAGPCFPLQLNAPDGCGANLAGPYCVSFPEGEPSAAARRVIVAALNADAGKDLWSALPRPPPLVEPTAVAAKLRHDWATPPQLVALTLALALLFWGSRRASRELALVTAVALLAGVWLDHVNPPAWAGDDEAAGLVLAQDCVKLSVCHTESLDSGVPGFTNGAVWLHLLTAVGLLGGTTWATRMVVIVFMSLGVGLVFLTTRRWIRPSFAPAAAVFAVYGLARGGDLSASNLVDASAAFFPAALCSAALLVFVHTRPLPALIIAAAQLSLAVNMHVASASLLPALIAIAAFGGRRPWLAAVAATVTYFSLAFVTSSYALFDSWDRINPMVVRAGVAGWVGVVIAGTVLRGWFASWSAAAKTAFVAAWLLLPHGLGVVWLEMQHRPPTDRYLPPIIAPLAVLVAALLVGPLEWIGGRVRLAFLGRWVPVAAGVGCVAMAPSPHTAGQWTFEDGRIVAEHLEKKGWCYSEQFGRIQGPQCTSYAYAAMPYACPAAGPSDFRKQLRLWVTDASRVPAGIEALPTRGGHVVLMSEVQSWIDKQRCEVCFESGGEKRCSKPELPDAPPFLYSVRREMGFGNANHMPPYTVSYAFPLQAVAGQTHRFSFVDDPGSFGPDAGRDTVSKIPKCGWLVTEATGMKSDRPLPANPVELTSIAGESGRLVIERVVGGPDCPGGYPGRQLPCHLETTSDDPEWMRQP